MRRLTRVLLTAFLTLTLLIASVGSAFADHDGDDWESDWNDPYAEEFDEGWYDDGYEPETGTFDDEWYDEDYDPYDETWYDDDGYNPYDETTFDDEWFDPETGTFEDEYDDGYDPETGTFEDEWYDEDYDPYDETTFDDGWHDATISEAAVTTLLDALDACLGDGGSGFGTCVLDAIDALYGEFFPADEFEDAWDDGAFGDAGEGDLDDEWYDDGFDDEWDSGDFGDESYDEGWYDDETTTVDDPDAAAAILARFNELIPQEWRDRIVEFSLETDGRDGVVAAVEPLSDDLTEWALYVDPADADFELDSTLIHEFAHVLTLNESQLDAQLVYSDQEYEAAAAACSTYFTGEGCAKTTSYIAQFVDLFWDPIMDEFDAINSIESEAAWEEAMFDFYDDHSTEFVSDYAVTNPAEDMSETFAAFVAAPELPEGNTVAEQKILFFSQFPELMALRDSIRAVL